MPRSFRPLSVVQVGTFPRQLRFLCSSSSFFQVPSSLKDFRVPSALKDFSGAFLIEGFSGPRSSGEVPRLFGSSQDSFASTNLASAFGCGLSQASAVHLSGVLVKILPYPPRRRSRLSLLPCQNLERVHQDFIGAQPASSLLSSTQRSSTDLRNLTVPDTPCRVNDYKTVRSAAAFCSTGRLLRNEDVSVVRCSRSLAAKHQMPWMALHAFFLTYFLVFKPTCLCIVVDCCGIVASSRGSVGTIIEHFKYKL